MKTIKVNFPIPFLEPIFYLLALGFGLGFYIGEINCVSYPAFIAPALICISMMYSAFFECIYGSFVRMYYQKTFDAIVGTPLNVDEVIFGEILWGSTKSVINASIMLLVVSAFKLVKLPDSIFIIPLAFIVGFVFSSIAMCFTAVSPTIDSFNYPIFLFYYFNVSFQRNLFPFIASSQTNSNFIFYFFSFNACILYFKRVNYRIFRVEKHIKLNMACCCWSNINYSFNKLNEEEAYNLKFSIKTMHNFY